MSVNPMTTTQAPEGDRNAELVKLGRGLADNLEQGHWSMADAIQMIRGLCAALSVPVNGQGSGSSADADTHRAAEKAVVNLEKALLAYHEASPARGDYDAKHSEYLAARQVVLFRLRGEPFSEGALEEAVLSDLGRQQASASDTACRENQ